MAADFDVIIAGTEKISEKVMNKITNLKFISRVGIGLDGVDLITAEKKELKSLTHQMFLLLQLLN